ncbi:hypothetical protein [Enterococcus hirae]|uniref:hypothetical protein n=1 Tax=Enterococcus hirae TaxID=1354 RepID=UPI0013718A44|nr:hypothetical protein [Enterococcus hirae]NAE18342.1 hypothetical protein [Enterococcus hirae]
MEEPPEYFCGACSGYAAGEDFVGLWDRFTPDEPVVTFPRTLDGKKAALAALAARVDPPILDTAILDGEVLMLDGPSGWGDVTLLHLRENRQLGVYSRYRGGRWRNRMLSHPGAMPMPMPIDQARRLGVSLPGVSRPLVPIRPLDDAIAIAEEELFFLEPSNWVPSPYAGLPLGDVPVPD